MLDLTTAMLIGRSAKPDRPRDNAMRTLERIMVGTAGNGRPLG
jgi:hypothetical protein